MDHCQWYNDSSEYFTSYIWRNIKHGPLSDESSIRIINLSTFKLECLQSSNVVRLVGDCEISSIAHENGTPHLRKGNTESLIIKKGTHIFLDGKYNSTAIKSENERAAVKKEVKWNVKTVGSFMDSERDDRLFSVEYSSGYNFNDSISTMDESQLGGTSDAFPIPLNPLFDLSALVMVKYKSYYIIR